MSSKLLPELTSPLKQFKSGFESHEIVCKLKMTLVTKHNDSPACVKPESIPKLIERKWIVFEQSPKNFSEQIREQTDGPPGAGILGNEHVHASILVKIFGDTFDFSVPEYQIKSPWIHFEGEDGTTIHKHATGVNLGYLFDTLGMVVDSRLCYNLNNERSFCTNHDHTLRFFINDNQNSNVQDYEIKDGDRILISYAATSPEDIESQLAELNSQKIVTEFAVSYGN